MYVNVDNLYLYDYINTLCLIVEYKVLGMISNHE